MDDGSLVSCVGMKIAACGWCVGLGLSLACSVAPSQIGASGSGESASSSTTASDSVSTGAVVDGTGPIADGSGGASSQGVSSSDGGTTQGVQPGTSTGDTTGSASNGNGTTAEGSEGDQQSTGESNGESSGMQVPSCDDLFGAAPDYLLCAETDQECQFNATTGGGNCDQMCGMFGAACNAAFDNPNSAGQECDIIMPNTDTCATNRGTEICVCAK